MSVKKNLFLFSQFVVLLFMLFSCTNFFHNIIPPDDKDIINFQVEYKNGSRSVAQTPDKNNIITITVPTDTDITSLIPIVNISEKAEIIPGTLPYLMQMFPDRDIMSLAVEMQKAQIQGNFINWFVNLILQNEGFKIPKLETPIDFTMPVSFYVISGQGNYKVYTVKVVRENVGGSELNPYDPTKTEKKILSFTVENQIGETKIDNINNSVEFELPPEVNIKSILPNIQVSEGAKPLPLVQNYLLECGFTFTQIIDFCTGYSTTTDVNRYISIYLQKNNNLVIPDISIPIDFSSEIEIAVIAGDRSANIYSVNTIVNESLPFISEFSFGKTKNPYLVKDAKILIGSQDINAELLYPMEMELNYSLIPDFVFIGDKVTYKMGSAPEVEIISGQTSIPFDIIIDSCTLIVYAGTNFIEYNLNLYREEDPDSIRSITDYRFKKNKNSSIKENVVASIYNEGDLGLITGTILYEGDIAPYELIPEFITPGTVTLNGVKQISGTTKNSFEYSADYLCTSKNGLYCRVYTIKFDFIKVEPAVAIIKNFSFPDYLNSGITQSAQGIIDEVTNTIRVEVEYYGNEIPYDLIPQFSATGPVYISNLEQTSGFSTQNFRYSKYYTVKSSEDSSVSKIYKVEVVFTPDPTSACEILSFGFLKTDNPSLTKNVEAKISQRDLSIFALMPYGSGAKEGTKLIPYFTVKGNVTVDGIAQISGVNAQDFSNEIIYTVTSENGYNQKKYKITLQESGDVIYVDINAVGRNNGTSWKDAYIDLNLALDQAALLPAEASAEIWVTAPQDKVYYSTSSYGFKLDKEGSITILGGFNGTEENSTDREFDDNGNLVNRTKIDPISSGNGLFLCNDLIKDYVHIEGIESNKTIKSFFMTWIYGTGYVKSFEKSNITINDSKFTTGNYSNKSIASSGYDNTYKVKIINSEFTSLLDESSEENTFHIENCNAITKYESYIELKGSNIIFNNNTIPGGYAKISLKSTGKLEFENNIASKPDSVIITSTETYTGIETEIDEPVWYLSLQGECDLTLENMTFASLYANSGVNAEINNCKFIKANIANYSSPTPDLYLYSNSNITVNDSTFTNRRIYQQSNSNLTLNNCDVSICNDTGGDNIYSLGNLSINEGSYKLKTVDDNNFYVKGNLNINGGSFNIDHAGKYASFYVECDATISNAKFNFTGDNTNDVPCVSFAGSNYISNITNSEFIINAKTFKGFQTFQKELSINESNIDINISSETSTCYGFYGSAEFTITDSTLDITSTSSEYTSYGIYGSTEFTVKDSTLDITSTSTEYFSYGIYGSTEFTVKDSTLDITSTSSKSYSYGIYGFSSFTITDSTLDITSTSSKSYSYGICGYSSFTITDSTLDIKSSSTESYSYCIRGGGILSIEESDVTVTSTSTSSTSYGIYSNLSSKNTNYTINAQYGIESYYSESKIEGGKINISYAGTSNGQGIYCSNIKSAEISVIHKLVDDFYNASTIEQMQNASIKLSSLTTHYSGIWCDILEDCTIKKIMTHNSFGITTDKIINTKITTASKSILATYFMSTDYIENCNINIEPDSYHGIIRHSYSGFTIKGGTYTIKTANNNGYGICVIDVPVTISGATFKNSVSKAPCIYLNSSNINIKDSTFSGCKNEAPSSIFNHRGGALCVDLKGGSCKISKCTFKNNKIVNKSNEVLALAQGGAGLAVSILANNVTLHVTNCTFDGNDADGKANGHHFWASNNWTTGEKFDGCNYSESGTTFTNPKDGRQGIIN